MITYIPDCRLDMRWNIEKGLYCNMEYKSPQIIEIHTGCGCATARDAGPGVPLEALILHVERLMLTTRAITCDYQTTQMCQRNIQLDSSKESRSRKY